MFALGVSPVPGNAVEGQKIVAPVAETIVWFIPRLRRHRCLPARAPRAERLPGVSIIRVACLLRLTLGIILAGQTGVRR